MEEIMKKLFFLLAGLAMIMTAHAGEADVKRAAQALIGDRGVIGTIAPSPMPGLYEVPVDGKVFYMDEKGQYFIDGQLIDVRSRRNLTAERENKLAQIKFSDLPLNLAIKQVRGNGKRVMATFEDPNCGYCKKLAKEIQTLNDVTVYTFAMPILSPDSHDKSRNIMCAADPAKAWNDWMVNNVVPPEARCDAPIERILALSQKLNV